MLEVQSMNSVWGNKVVISIFGESHGEAIGCVLDGLPSGISLDLDSIQNNLERRSAKNYKLATPRKEQDKFEIVSGFFNGKTTGTPLCAFIKNENTRSRDYQPNLLRPGHADYTAFMRYSGFQDYRGGGHFSGRLTAPLVIAGSICSQVLKQLYPEITINSRIVSIGKVEDKRILDLEEFENITLDPFFPLFSPELKELMQSEIKNARNSLDSVGGVVECWINNVPAGIGNPIFNSIESQLSSILFSIPAVKGVEFGTGFDLAKMNGSIANDNLYIEDTQIKTRTNHNGGINGGISNGMPIIFKCAFKPTPSIAQIQNTVDFETKENKTIEVHGRHDPCIVLRAPVVVEAAAAICILNLLLESY